ncbi:uncharacterized protein EDB91DRAFT_1057248, partial [Suillus paluster]|uniref:uncharacterized protein n=1 Tax=Suillus paluster TaxID=48578 RepID=UPI001B867835
PKGWTDKVAAEVKVKTMLADCMGTTSDKIQDVLEEKHGDQYVFQVSSYSKFYFWNCASDEGAEVTKPKGKEELWKQMDKDITQVEVKKL